MTLTELRYAVALDETRHFGQAAARCFVSQPTLSIAIRKLEDRLGTPLFERHRGRAEVTPIGRQLLDQARRVLAEAALLEEIAAGAVDELSGPLRLGAIFTVAPYLLPNLVPGLGKIAPKMPLVIEENFTDTLSERLRRGDLDIIVVALPFAPAGVRVWPLYEEEFVVAMSPRHTLADESQIDPAELAEERLLMLGPGHCFRDQVLAAVPHPGHSADLGNPTQGSSLETIRHMVASGLGVTVLPASSVDLQSQTSSGLLVRPFKAPVPKRCIALAWRRSYPRMRAVEAVRQAILACPTPGIALLPDSAPSQ
ncbi:MAG: hydrogen peroxide-inducible genes activator [Oceanococcaceae bacterium]